ncbi:MarR family transcriptional regulator, partial [Bacteroides thetaiotaomicron]
KSLAGFVSPFLRKKAYVLQPNQCHLTVSDLASEWHWHRATVRSFLSAMEAFGLLTRIQLPKSVVITMTVQSGQAAQPRNAQEQPDFARQLREVLSDWVIGKTTAAETGVICGQLVSLAKTEIADRDTGLCLDTHSNTTSAHSGTLVTEHRETALCCIAHAALQKILHKSRFDDSSPLVDFFRFDLGEEWAAFIESAKDLAGLILDTEASVTDFDMDEDQERLKSLRKPFLSLLAKAQAMVD